jgi:peptidyl-prolyl cis-trans isomerase SurA
MMPSTIIQAAPARHTPRQKLAALLLAAGALVLPGAAPAPALAQGRAPIHPPAADPSDADSETIVAVVNGDAVTSGDVTARTRLFALTSGLPMTPDVLNRLRAQVTQQLVDERLRMQEVERRKIVVRDQEVADAIREIEQRNNSAPGSLAAHLASEGVSLRTLVNEVRAQIGWTRVLRDELGPKADISDADIAEQIKLLQAQTGQTEYRISEIFIPVDDPARNEDARGFADTVITQLRAGAPFAVAAAQFSQSQTALQGGDRGWVRANEVDPEVAAVISQMPQGAISNPIPVPGGYVIVTLQAKREIGHDVHTMLSMRQAFVPFTTQLNPAAPTDQQRQALDKARSIAASVKSCDAMEAANQSVGAKHPANPGDVDLDNVSPPQFKALLASLPIGKATPPLVSNDGVAVVIICSRDEKNDSTPSKQEISQRLLSERVELVSRQLLRDLRRRATIEMRSGSS